MAHSGGARNDSLYYYRNAYVYEHTDASPGFGADGDSIATELVSSGTCDAEVFAGHVSRVTYKRDKCKARSG